MLHKITGQSVHVDRAVGYMRDVIEGRQVACRWVRLACERQLYDLERALRGEASFPYRFDVEAADRVCAFLELLPHVKGEWAGQPIRLEPWQQFSDTTVFGWLRLDTGARRFRTLYEEVARKNAKSTRTSGIALYMTVADDEAGADCYCAATKKDQAKIVFGDAQRMAERTPALRAHFGLRVLAGEIRARDGSFLKPIDAKGSTQDGLNVHLDVNDELHAWKGRELYDVLATASGSRRQSLQWNITTAGSDQSGVCYEQRIYVTKILLRVITDETYFGIIYTLDEGDDWKDPANWIKANPNLGVSLYAEEMERSLTQALQSPKAANAFKNKRLNIWTNAASPWMDMEAWERAGDPSLQLEAFADDLCILSLDLASKRDLIADIKLILRDREVLCFSRFYLPRATVEESDNASYQGWAEEGHITLTEGAVADYDVIEENILADHELLTIAEVCYDPHQATMLVNHLLSQNIVCVKVPPTVLNFSEPMKELEAMVIDGRFHHDGNPVMTWCMSNVVAFEDRKDNIYPRKERPHLKIDGPVAAIAGMKRIMAHREGEGGGSYLEHSPMAIL